jgi:hypothetical protein
LVVKVLGSLALHVFDVPIGVFEGLQVEFGRVKGVHLLQLFASELSDLPEVEPLVVAKPVGYSDDAF